MSNNNFPPLKTILLDMDGVIWRGYEPVIDIKALFEKIHQLGCQPFCVTNNATSTVDEYLEKLKNFDVALSSDQIITSAEATAKYLEDHIQKGSSIYVIGEDGLKETIIRYGFSMTQDPEKEVPGCGRSWIGFQYFLREDLYSSEPYPQWSVICRDKPG